MVPLNWFRVDSRIARSSKWLGSRTSLVSRAEQGYGRIDGRFDDLTDGSSVLDGKRGQFTKTTQQDHGQRRGERRQGGPPEAPGWGQGGQQGRQARKHAWR